MSGAVPAEAVGSEVSRSRLLELAELVVAQGPRGKEDVLVPGLTIAVHVGEVVVLVARREAGGALLDVLARRRRASFGRIRLAGEERAGAPVRPKVPRGVTVLRPEGLGPRNRGHVVVLDGRSTETLPYDEEALSRLVRRLRECSSAGLVITDRSQAHWQRCGADRITALTAPGPPGQAPATNAGKGGPQ